MHHKNSNGEINEQPVFLRQFIFVLFKQKKLILSVFSSMVLIVAISSFLMTPIYRAQAKIIVERNFDSQKAVLFQTNIPLGYEKYNWINSEIEIIVSYPVMTRVVKDLGLDQIEKKDQVPTIEKDKEELFEKAQDEFRDNLSVRNEKDSNVIQIGYESGDPALAAAVVDKVIETYLVRRSEIYDETKAYKFFETQQSIVEKKLQDLEQRLASYKNREEIASPQKQVEILLSKLGDFEKILTDVRTKRIGKAAKLAMIKEQLENSSEINIPSTEASDSPSREKYIAKLKGELLDIQIRKDGLLQRFKPTYQGIVELEVNIASILQKITAEIKQIIVLEETSIKALKAEEYELRRSIKEINREMGELAQKEYEITQLSRGIDDNRHIYSMLLKQREEARISLAKSEGGVEIKVINPAVIPKKPIKPRKLLNVALAMIFGLLGGVSLAFFEEYTGLTPLAFLREIRNEVRNGHNPEGSEKKIENDTSELSRSPYSDL